MDDQSPPPPSPHPPPTAESIYHAGYLAGWTACEAEMQGFIKLVKEASLEGAFTRPPHSQYIPNLGRILDCGIDFPVCASCRLSLILDRISS